MAYVAYVMAAVVLFAAVALVTGWWRIALLPFRIRPEAMTVDRLGLSVADEHVPRINSVLESFAGGFNRMLAAPSASAWERYCDSLPALCRPFAHEGAAMGYTVRRLFRYDPVDFERRVVKRHPGFCYLHYVGLGFWSGMRNHDPRRLARVVRGLDPLHGFLCYDGYGFKHGFFDYPKDPTALGRLDLLEGYARNAAYQGVGRALFFYHMQELDVLIDRLDGLGVHAADAAAGVGLAAVFIFHDRLEFALEVAGAMPERWHSQVHLGMCFGLKARSINDAEQFERDVAGQAPPVQQAIRTTVGECDRIETELRSQRAEDGYRRWRHLVTQWMADHVDYPLAAVRTEPAGLCRQAATA